MKITNKKLLMSLSVLATPFAVESFTENEAQANTYTLNNSVQTYATAQNASKQANSGKTYGQGTYYVYKVHNGMINISKTPGKAGAWINPNANVTKPVTTQNTVAKTNTQTTQTSKTTSNTTTNSSVYTVTSPQKTYKTATHAAAKVGATSTYQPGSYFIYRNYNGMLNISKISGRAGAWINPTEKVTPSQTSQSSRPVSIQTTKPSPTQATVTNNTVAIGQYKLNTATKTYASAANASKKTGARSSYAAGTYYVYKSVNGMLNISKTAGKPGAWINPADNVVVSTPPRQTTQTTSSKTETTQSSKTQTQKPTTSTSNKSDGSKFELTVDTAVYANAANAKSGVGATSRYAKGSYFIYKNVNGMLNISKTPGKAGAWINPNAASSVVAKGNVNLTDSPIAPVSKNPITSDKYTTANKIYSVMTEFGLNKYQIAGMLGNFEAESNVNPGIFEAYFRPSAKTNARQLADKYGPTVENLFNGGWEQFKSDYAARGIELTEKGYDYTGTGVHWLGVGLGQWTGPASKGLWEFSKSRGMSMWSVDTQLAYMLSKLPGDVSLYNRLVTFKGMSANSATQGADNFAKEWERNVKNLAAQKRRNEANKWLAELNKMKVDKNYARTIMSKTTK